MTTQILATVGGILVLIVLSAFFSGSETALTAASRPRLHQLHRAGDRRADIVDRLRDNKERMIGAILLGNNLVNILASALATSLFIAMVGEAGVVYATGAMTLLVLIFGELLPKSYALRNAEGVALRIAPLMRLVVALLAPVTDILQWSVRIALRAVGVRARGDEERHASLEELRGAIELHGIDDPTVRHERAMLRSILDLADVDVGMVMRHRRDMVTIDADLPTASIIDQALESPYTRIPLWRGDPDDIVGILHAKALLRAMHAHRGELDRLRLDAICAPPWFIPESTTLLDQLQAFRQRHEHFALVVDEYGALMGLVTLEDIIEEIVGDISDETDVTPVGVRPQRDGSYLIDGGVTIRDLNRRFDWELPDQHAATLAGLVIHEARLIPEVGQIFVHDGFRYEIVRRQRNQITSIRVTPPQAYPSEAPAP